MKQSILLTVSLALLFSISCNSFEDPPEPGGNEPISGQIGDNKIGPISVVQGHTTLEIEASWIGFGNPDIVEYGFVWGNNNDPQPTPENSKIWKQNPELTVGLNKAFGHTIQDLQPETEYWVRTYMKADGISAKLGLPEPAKTLGIPPSVETGLSSNVDAGSFTVKGKILSLGSSEIVEYGHIVSPSGPPSINSERKISYSGPVQVDHEFESQFTGLQEGELYYFNTYAINQSGALALGEARTVRTEALPYLYVSSITLVSDHGNLDNKVNRGEELEYQIKVKNEGSLAANGVKLELITDSDFVEEINPDIVELGSIPGGNTQEIAANNIRIKIDRFANWDSTVNIQLLLSDQEGKFWTDTLSFMIESSFVVPDGLVAYYTFDRDDTTSLFTNSELSNNKYKAFKNNGLNYSDDKPDASSDGYALFFDADQSTYLNVPSNPLNGESERTYSFWMKTSTPGTQLFFERRKYAPYFYISLHSSFRYYIDFHSNGWLKETRDIGLSTDGITDGNWHFLVLIASSEGLKMYVDGFHAITVSDNTYQNAFNSIDEGMTIGALVRSQSTDVQNPFDGLMDNIRFYNRALNSDEILDIYLAKQ